MNSLKLPLLLFIALIVGCFATSCGGEKANKDENTEVSSVNDVPDSLSFIIACLPTYESLPFYYAKAAGIADSLSLPLRIKTYQSQFDADTALLGTRADAGVTDLVRQQHYAAQGKMRGYVAWIPLQGEWQLLVGGRLRLTEMKQLKQRTIAIARYSSSDQYTAHLRDSLRWKFDDMLRPQINDYRVRQQMLDNEQIDAAVLPQPFALRAKGNGQRVLATLPFSYHHHALYLSAQAQQDAKKSKQAQLLQRVYNEAVQRINHKPGAVLDSVLIRTYKLTPEQVKQVHLPHYNEVKTYK